MLVDMKPTYSSKNTTYSSKNILLSREMEVVRKFEQLAQVLCLDPSPTARKAAQLEASKLEAEDRYYDICLDAFAHTSCNTTQMFILARISEKLTVEWNQNLAPKGMKLQQHFYDILLKRELSSLIRSKLFSLIARICALSWNTNTEIQSKLIFNIIKAYDDRPLAVIKMLSELVHEINLKRTTKTPNEFRKRTSSFTRSCLFSIVSLAVKAIVSRSSYELLICGCLGLLHDCLIFDFSGTSWGSRTEDFFIVQIPKEWRKNISFAKLAEAHYEIILVANPESKAIPQALANLVLLMHARKPINAAHATAVLHTHAKYFEKVLLSGSELLSNEFNHVQVCRMMVGIKANYQVVDLLKTPNAESLLQAMLNFTNASFGHADFQHNYYLLEFWTRFVMAVPYLRNTRPEQMHAMIAEIADAFIMSRLKYIELNFQHSPDMFPAQKLKSSMEHIRYLLRFNYDSGYQVLMRELTPRLEAYENGNGTEMQQKLVQWQLGWLCHVVGTCLSISRPLYPSQKKQESQLLENDGRLVALIFNLIALSHRRLPHYRRNQLAGAIAFMDRGILDVLRNFQECHLSARGTPKKIKDRHNRSLLNIIQKQLGDEGLSEIAIINAIVDKTYLNLRYFEDEKVLTISVDLLHDLCVKFRNKISCRDISERIIRCHKNNEFRFKLNSRNLKLRINFYNALYQLLMEFDDYFILIRAIYDLYDQRFANLAHNQQLRSNKTLIQELIGDIHDLQGLAQAIQKTSHYVDFLDFLLPHFPFLEAVLLEAVRTQSTNVSTPLLGFFVDLTSQKYQRISFSPSSTKGILLFNFVMKLLVKIGASVDNTSEARAEDIYESRYKVVTNCIILYQQTLAGEFVRYGQLLIFGEHCVQNALQSILSMIDHFGLENLLYFPEIERAYWSFVRVVLKQQLPTLLQHDYIQAWDFLFKSFAHASKPDQYTAEIITSIFHQLCVGQKEPFHPILEKYMEDNEEFLFKILCKLFHALLFDPSSQKMNALCQALYKIISAYPPIWNHYFENLAKCQRDPRVQTSCNQLEERLNEMPNFSRKSPPGSQQVFTEALLVFRTQTINLLQELQF